MNATTSLLGIQHTAPSSVISDGDWSLGVPFNSFLSRPLLEDILHEIGPLPREALFMGQAEDGKPVLLNLFDPVPGPVLIVGETGSGKTDLLRVVAEYIASTHTPGEVQFAVVTNQAEEWQDRLADASHCVGVFSSHGSGARRLVHSLAAWLSANRMHSQSVVLFVDGLDEVQYWDDATIRCLHQVLMRGAEKRVWCIATISRLDVEEMGEWQRLFQTRVFAGNLDDQGNCTNSPRELEQPWFSTRENGKWIHFWIPSLGL